MPCDTIKIETLDADEVVSIVTQGPQGPSGSEAATLTTVGDMLYRDTLAPERLPIGEPGQVLKVNSTATAPEWGEADAGVTSWNDLEDKPSTFPPETHAASHFSAGADPIAPSDIGAQSLFTNTSIDLQAATTTLTAARAARVLARNIHANGANLVLPTTGNNVGDIFVITNNPSSFHDTINIQFFQSGPNINVTLVTASKGETYRFIAVGGSAWQLVAVDTHTHPASQITSGTFDIARLPVGTTTGTVAAGDDSRFSDIPDPSSATPQALGTAAAGTSDDYSRGDHIHAAPALDDLSNVSAAAPSDNDVLVFDTATSTWVAEAAAGGGSTTQTDIFTANGTWTKPAGAKLVHYLLIGGGGGGGAGYRDNTSTLRGAGGGGGGGGVVVGRIDASVLGSTEAVVVGAGGGGGTNATVNFGTVGGVGGASSFGSTIGTFATNNAGRGTDTVSGASGGGAANAVLVYATQGSASIGTAGSHTGNAGNAADSVLGPASGGGGGGIDASNNYRTGGNGGGVGHARTGLYAGGASAANAAGGNGVAAFRFLGTGGAGGSPDSSTGAGNPGGNGGLYGGGGGGGSGALTGAGGSTAGGDGANGIAIITTYF